VTAPRLLAALAAIAVASAATASSAQISNPDSALAEALGGIRGEDLSLDAALSGALEHATGVHEAEATVRAAEGALRRENGAFDPVLFGGLTVSEDDVPNTSPFSTVAIVETQSTLTAAGARIRLPIGTELEATLEAAQIETNDDFATVEPMYTASGRLRLRQPLLKGFGPAAGGARSAARSELHAANARRSDAALAVRADASATYWDLYAAERDLAVQRLVVEQARAFFEQAESRAAAGLVGPSDVATAKVVLTEQELDAIDEEERLDEVSDRLVTLLGRAPAAGTRWHAATEPPTELPVGMEDALVARALERNGELRAARRDLEARRAEAGAAKWNALPALDVVGSLGGNGLAGEPQPVSFGDLDGDGTADTLFVPTSGGQGDAIERALDRDAPTWSVGVMLEVPIGFREGRGEKDRLAGEVARAEQRVIALERRVREDVRARHRELAHGVRRLTLAREGVEAALEQVRVGRIDYDNGRTTAFELVRLGADFAAAQERYSDALVRTAKAAAELERLAPEENP
jgi:outer membrane protein TolC